MPKSKSHRDKAATVPKPMLVKKEKTEEDRTLHSMAHYIDDRLELVKQIFGTLKPKTIMNLAPEFLKKQELVDIEEMCLNELLCISTKRLRSIINSTKCPTDTESSGDSDVERREEHVSLEEISSDSEIEGASNSKGRRKLIAKTERDNNSAAEKNKSSGPISVLELLELQARARAIRSQLALEPVTKIEVDSDAENAKDAGGSEGDKKSAERKRKRHHDRQQKSNSKEKQNEKGKDTEKNKEKAQHKSNSVSDQSNIKSTETTTKSNSKNTNGSSSTTTTTATTATTATVTNRPSGSLTIITPSPAAPTKRIKLKRNYRLNANSTPTAQPPQTAVPEPEVKREHISRSTSPDVIPIVAEPETVLISDSSDGESKAEEAKSSKANEERTTPTVITDTPTAITETTTATTEKATAATAITELKINEPIIEELEEGEISESEVEEKTADKEDLQAVLGSESDQEETPTTNAVVENVQVQEETIEQTREGSALAESKSGAIDNKIEEITVITDEIEPSMDAVTDLATNESSESNLPTAGQDTAPISDMNLSTIERVHPEADSPLAEDDDHNDDVISLEGGDLESEMIEHLEEESSNTQSSAKEEISQSEQEADIISLDSSEDEKHKKAQIEAEEISDSWHARYLRSTKVSKVLATSRLSKRVRDNLKKSKRALAQPTPPVDEEVNTPSDVYTSQHEDGSVEQYKELLEMQARKN